MDLAGFLLTTCHGEMKLRCESSICGANIREYCELVQLSTVRAAAAEERCRMSQTWSPLTVNGLLWLGITLLCITPHVVGGVPTPQPWPSPFYALMYQNFSDNIGLLDLVVRLGKWKEPTSHKRSVQISDTRHAMAKRDNPNVGGSRFGSKCGIYDAGVGLLHPNWLDRATYVGTQKEDGFTVNVWTKAYFITYREDVVSKRPVSWTFSTGRDVHVITWQPGTILAEEKWNVPLDCLPDKEKVDSSASVVPEPRSPTSDFREWMLSRSMR